MFFLIVCQALILYSVQGRPHLSGRLRTCDSRRKDPVDRLDSLIGRSSRARVKEKFEFESLLGDPIGRRGSSLLLFTQHPPDVCFRTRSVNLKKRKKKEEKKRNCLATRGSGIKIYGSSFYHLDVFTTQPKMLQMKYKI